MIELRRKERVIHFPVDELKRQYRDQIISEGVDQVVMKNRTCNDAVGPGNAFNPVLEQLGHGSKTNDWVKLIRRTSYLFLWYAKVLGDGPVSVHLSKELLWFVRSSLPFFVCSNFQNYS